MSIQNYHFIGSFTHLDDARFSLFHSAYPVILVNLIADEQLAVEVRQLAGVTLKRYVLCHWSSNECSDFTPPAATEEVSE